jgi:hypothetical protein
LKGCGVDNEHCGGLIVQERRACSGETPRRRSNDRSDGDDFDDALKPPKVLDVAWEERKIGGTRIDISSIN